MAFGDRSLDEARSKVWGRLMMDGKYLDALLFASALLKLADAVDDVELREGASAMIAKSAEELHDLHLPLKKEEEARPSVSCSFCGQSPPKVKLGAGNGAFVCNECVAVFSKMFEAE